MNEENEENKVGNEERRMERARGREVVRTARKDDPLDICLVG